MKKPPRPTLALWFANKRHFYEPLLYLISALNTLNQTMLLLVLNQTDSIERSHREDEEYIVPLFASICGAIIVNLQGKRDLNGWAIARGGAHK